MSTRTKNILLRALQWAKEEVLKGNLFIIVILFIVSVYIWNTWVQPKIDAVWDVIAYSMEQDHEIKIDQQLLKEEIEELKRLKRGQLEDEPIGEPFKTNFGVSYEDYERLQDGTY